MLERLRSLHDRYNSSHSASSPISPLAPVVHDMQRWHAKISSTNADDILLNNAQRMFGETLFSVEGRLGVGNYDIEKGDILMVTPALTRLLVVRHAPGIQDNVPADRSDDCYRLISGAYLDGLMENGWEDKGLCREIIQQPTMTITIY